MSPIAKSDILALSLTLSLAERIELVQDIWDSIAEHPEAIEVTEEEKAELDRRLEAYRRDPSAVSSWAEVLERIRRRG